MECILHVACNMPFEKWSAMDAKNKAVKQENKHRIQNGFKVRMNLRLDAVQQGTGSSNNGNTSMRFFF